MRRPAILLALFVPSFAFGWGFDGHRRLASMMQDAMPANHCLRNWYAARQTSALQDSACDPDRWRYMSSPQYDPNEWPRHFIEVDWVSPPSSYPRIFDQAVNSLGRSNAFRNGTVPWRVEELYLQLVQDFRSRNTTAILGTSFILSHYVTDSFSVLHDTKNSDPNNGLHARWESDMLDVAANINGVATLAATFYGTPGRADPRNNIFDIAIVGNGLVPQLVMADTAAMGNLTTLYTSTRDLTARRWGDAVTVLSSILWTAWAEAGSPELSGFTSTCGRAAPTAEIVIRGFPPMGGFTHPDGGPPVVPDAGVDDAGAGGGQGGGDGGADFDAGVDPGPTQPTGCACSSVEAPALLAALVLLARRRVRFAP